jgi:hypothetical protein
MSSTLDPAAPICNETVCGATLPKSGCRNQKRETVPDSGMIVRKANCLSAWRTLCPKIKRLALQRNTSYVGAMSNDLIEGMSWIIERACPNSDVLVTDVVSEDGSDELLRISGLNLPCDYLTHAEASTLAGALNAAVDEVSSGRPRFWAGD